MVEDMPAVKFSVFVFGYDSEVFLPIVKGVIVLVVHFHSCWAVGDEPVHAYRFGFAGNDYSGDDIFGA